ncbi:serine acetyltransferase [Microbacterium oryzae]|uniref:serine O-acetyltransferase n=1 Tax=Microbacterium oryzae TaxID=743009 RepID=UPI0025B1936D|nr:serine acetyltransferase [Microbacterium oryzae]MDN3310120.1 serine acetyltransferase [Microbacterium oryzae]
MRGAFAGDLARMLGGVAPSWRARAAFLLFNSELHCVACYRFGRFTRRMRVRHPIAALPLVVAHRVWNRRCTHQHQCDIHRDAMIGPGLLIMHRGGITVGPARIGPNCTLYQNVTIGMRVAQNDQGVPRIGRNVWIGPGATISGDVSIGDGVTISAGTVLTRDVPSRCLVAGNPGRVIAQDYDNSAMVNAAES